SQAPQTNVSILIHDERITEVRPGFVTPNGAEVIDLSKATVLPGLIDAHVHITDYFDGGDPVAEQVTVTGYDHAFIAVGSAQATLEAGFTSIRDVGAHDPGLVIALKRAIRKGEIEGPRMWVAGPLLGPTAGHGDESTGLDPDVSLHGASDWLVDGAD